MKKSGRTRLTYDREELYDLWIRFRNNPDAVEILSGFANTTPEFAEELHKEFLLRYEAEVLGISNRGVEDRTRKHI